MNTDNDIMFTDNQIMMSEINRLRKVVRTKDALLKHVFSTLGVILGKVIRKEKFTPSDIAYYNESYNDFKGSV